MIDKAAQFCEKSKVLETVSDEPFLMLQKFASLIIIQKKFFDFFLPVKIKSEGRIIQMTACETRDDR